MNKSELSKVTIDQIMAMDGTEDWFARVVQPKPWEHSNVASSRQLSKNCPEQFKKAHPFAGYEIAIENHSCDFCTLLCRNCEKRLTWETHKLGHCTVPPPITEPLEVLAFRLANEAWLGMPILHIAMRCHDLFGVVVWEQDDVVTFTPMNIIKAALLAIKKGIT